MTIEEKRERDRAYARAWHHANRERSLANQKAWKKANRERCKAYKKAWHAANPESGRARSKAWAKANAKRSKATQKAWREANLERWKAALKATDKARRKTDPAYRIAKNIRTRLCNFFKGRTKSANTEKLLQCDFEWLVIWLEAGFKPGMTLENYGEWHIDHIRPLASFKNLTDSAQQRRACHWSNLQPLWAAENFIKNSKYNDGDLAVLSEVMSKKHE